jgi:hypothetical protein
MKPIPAAGFLFHQPGQMNRLGQGGERAGWYRENIKLMVVQFLLRGLIIIS